MWKKIIYEEKETNYSVSDDGFVRNDSTNYILKNNLQQGYHHVTLAINGISKRFRVHRLVAIAFIPNSDIKKIYINHRNGIRNDNRVENLEWCTPAENIRHAYNTGLAQPTNSRKVACYDMNGNLINKFNSITEAAIQTNSADEKITICCQGYRNSHNKMQWRYEEDAIDKLDVVKELTYSKQVIQMDLQYNVLNVYPSFREAARAVKGTSSAISRICSGTPGLHTHKNFRWKLADDIVQ